MPRYRISGNTKTGWAIVDTLPPGMKVLEYNLPRKWIAEDRCIQLEKDHMKTKYYYESFATQGGFAWKVYHYDESGNKEIVDRVERGFQSQEKALDAAGEFMEEQNIDGELV